MGELSRIFEELVRMLKDLPPGGFEKAYAQKPPTAAASRAVSFMCDKQQFKDAVRLAEMGAELAAKAHNPEELPQDPFVETILAGMRSLEAKVDQLALDTANLASNPPAQAKTFAAAAAGGNSSAPVGAKAKTGPKGKKPPSVPSPPPAPKLTLSQISVDRADFVELATDAELLASRATSALSAALKEQAKTTSRPPPPLVIRGITRNVFTGEINLHLNHQDSLRAALSLKSDAWVANINPDLTLKRRIYPIIVHGVPTTFKPESRAHTLDFVMENHGVLDTATKMVWANKHSIESGKPFSSLIIHLTDPAAANQAIANRICFKHTLKLTDKSTKRIKQCYTCLDFGHFAKSCSEAVRACSHCAGQHHYQACTKLANPVRCVNCIHHTLDTEFSSNPDATIRDMSDTQTALCAHSAFSNQCPLRRLQVAKNAHMSDYYDIPSHE